MTASETQIRCAVEDFRRWHKVPGVAVCTFSSHGPECAVAAGTASVESRATLTPDTVFRIYSVTKLLTGTLLLALASDGLVELDAPVRTYLPELRVRGAGGDAITVRHLLSHQAGWLPDAVRHGGLDRNPGNLAAVVMDEAARMPMLAAPGTIYSYSNLGVSLAGVVAQRVAGGEFGEVIRERLYDPLGMTRSTHDPAVAMTFPLAQHHVLHARGEPAVAHDARAGVKHEPASLCYSSAMDMARFGALQLGGARRVLPDRWLTELRRPHSDPRLDVDLRYGLTCYLGATGNGGRQVGHEGFLDGMWIKFVLDPTRDLGVVWLDNRGEELREHRYRVLAELFDGLGGPPTGRDRPHGAVTAGQATGDYHRFGAEPLRVRAAGEQLDLSTPDRRIHLVEGPAGTWVSRAEEGPRQQPPWGPHAGSRRVCLGVTTDRAGEVRFAHLNGLPYARLGQ